MRLHQAWDVRLYGVDTPEIFGRASDEEKQWGKVSMAFVSKLLEAQGDTIIIRTIKNGKFDYLVDVVLVCDENGEPFSEEEDLTLISGYLVARGYAVKYLGGKKDSWKDRKAAMERERSWWSKNT